MPNDDDDDDDDDDDGLSQDYQYYGSGNRSSGK